MSKRLFVAAIALTALALAALLAYSLERTAWLFGQFETWWQAAYAAAGVVELSAVALIVGASALAGLHPAARAWANRALLAVLSVGALANLSAGYLRGGAATLAAFGSNRSAYAVAAALWFVTNLAVPGLILCLSKLLEQLIVAAYTRSFAPLRTTYGQRRRLVRALIGLVRAARRERDKLTVEVRTAKETSELAMGEVRTHAAMMDAELDRVRIEAAQVHHELEQHCIESARLDEQTASLRTENARQRDMLSTKSAELDRLSAENAALSATQALDVRVLAQRLRDAGVSLRMIGAGLDVSEKTIRNWTMDVRTNGHTQEVTS